MTISAEGGPIITKGVEAPLGTANVAVGVAGVAPYITGTAENPDAGPNCFAHGNMFKDPLYRYQAGRGPLAAGGYANQAAGFVDHYMQTVDITPSAIATANIAALANVTNGTAMTLVAASGAGITVTTAAFTVFNSGLVVPTAQRRIDANPAWTSVSFASGALQAWNRAAVGRAISITGSASATGGAFKVVGYDIYGFPQTETITAGAGAVTTNGKKGWKWITSVTPQFTDAHNYSVGTADIFEFPLQALKFCQVDIMWNNTWITANTGFVAADVTNPATLTTGSVRGTYAVQSASDGTKQLQIFQSLTPAQLLAAQGAASVFGIVPV